MSRIRLGPIAALCFPRSLEHRHDRSRSINDKLNPARSIDKANRISLGEQLLSPSGSNPKALTSLAP